MLNQQCRDGKRFKLEGGERKVFGFSRTAGWKVGHGGLEDRQRE